VFLAFVVLLNIFAWMFLKALFLEPLEDPAWAILAMLDTLRARQEIFNDHL